MQPPEAYSLPKQEDERSLAFDVEIAPPHLSAMVNEYRRPRCQLETRNLQPYSRTSPRTSMVVSGANATTHWLPFLRSCKEKGTFQARQPIARHRTIKDNPGRHEQMTGTGLYEPSSAGEGGGHHPSREAKRSIYPSDDSPSEPGHHLVRFLSSPSFFPFPHGSRRRPPIIKAKRNPGRLPAESDQADRYPFAGHRSHAPGAEERVTHLTPSPPPGHSSLISWPGVPHAGTRGCRPGQARTSHQRGWPQRVVR
ncbi:hypothetical protein F4780DRAFT_765897 [Xylariomycetidae sp. FL0641]|nr:hypothetical protein F4780DRAFT_765897 [Xylariomycetidae sp. FL0641]